MNRLKQVISWIGRRSAMSLLAVLIVVAGTWGFIELLDEVKEGTTQKFDDSAIRWIDQHRGPKWLEETGRDITALGGFTVLALVTLAVAGYLLIREKFGAMWLVIIAVGGGLAISSVLKHSTARPRPDFVQHRSMIMTTSFPSGHSMMSAVVYLTLGSLMAKIEKDRVVKFYFLAISLILTGLVGVSRVYMTVHWPTDVLAGWTAGLVWALICWLVARYLQKRGAVEED